MTQPPYDQNATQFVDGDPVPRPHKDLDADPDIMLLFLGQLAFCYKPNPNGYCEIGINNKAGRHELSIVVREFTAGPPGKRIHWYPDDSQPDTPATILFDVNNPQTPGLFFYQPGVFDRSTSTNANDFRWIVDFEGPDLYNVLMTKKGTTLQPRLRIGNGTFFTEKTCAKFNVYNSQGTRALGSIARHVAAMVSLADGGYATLTMDGTVWRLDKKQNTKYLVIFSYDCSGNRCEWNPAGLSKYERNDFYLYYKTLTLTGDQEEFELIKDPPTPEPEQLSTSDAGEQAESAHFDLIKFLKMFSNDEAPCGDNGFFGRSTGLG